MFRQRLQPRFVTGFGSGYHELLFPDATVSVSLVSRRKCFRFGRLVVRAASRPDGASRRKTTGRRVYSEAQGELIPAPLKQVASFVAPVGLFFAVTFGMDWSLTAY